MKPICLLTLVGALCTTVSVATAQVRTPFGRRPQAAPRPEPIRGTLKSLGPSGMVLDVDGMEVALPLSRLTAVVLSGRVEDPALVLRPGAIVTASGNLEGPSGPVGTGGLTVILGTPRDRNLAMPQLKIGRPQVPGDPPPVTLRGRVVGLAPAVVVAAGRYRIPLRLPEKPDVAVQIHGPLALKLAAPGDDVTATIRPLGRPGAFVVERVNIHRKTPLSAEDLGLKPPAAGGEQTKKARRKRPAAPQEKKAEEEKKPAPPESAE